MVINKMLSLDSICKRSPCLFSIIYAKFGIIPSAFSIVLIVSAASFYIMFSFTSKSKNPLFSLPDKM